jgi:hypothetical protein
MALEVEGIVDGSMNAQKALRRRQKFVRKAILGTSSHCL